MVYFIIKCALSGIIIAVVSEVAKRSPAFGALIVSLPLVSLLGILWLWRDTGDAERIASHVESTFWYVLPSLPMFLILPAMLRARLVLRPLFDFLAQQSHILILSRQIRRRKMRSLPN
jgi:hypothetical protein